MRSQASYFRKSFVFRSISHSGVASSSARPVVGSSKPAPPAPPLASRVTFTSSFHSSTAPANSPSRNRSAMSEPSKACCTIPPVQAEDYSAKGKYETVEGRKTYITGPENSSKAIIFVFDIFGYSPQTLQGADILALSGKAAEDQYLVVVPDWFDGSPASLAWYPPQNDEQKKKLGDFFDGPAKPERVVPEIPKVIAAIEKSYPSVKEWAAIGYCWGGKMITVWSGKGDVPNLKATAQVHPAFVSAADGRNVKVPLLTLASGDEDWSEVQQLTANAPANSDCKLYKDSIHGWMAARSDLKDEVQAKTYRQGYEDVLEFYKKVW